MVYSSVNEYVELSGAVSYVRDVRVYSICSTEYILINTC